MDASVRGAHRRRRRPAAALPPPPLQGLLFALLLTVGLLLATTTLIRQPPHQDTSPSATAVDALLPEQIVEAPLLGTAVATPSGSSAAPTADPPSPAAGDRGKAEAAGERPKPPTVDHRLLSTVRDKTRAIPKGAYFHLLELALRIPVQQLEAAAVRNPPLAELVRYPERFRGKPVMLQGYVRRITLIDPGPNRLGLRSLYECAVFSDEFDRNPWIFVVVHVPEQMPKGDNLAERVTATGFFLKLWAYRAGDGLRFAPLLIGPRLVWHPAPAGGLGTLNVVLFVLLVSLVAVFAAVLWWSARSRRRIEAVMTRSVGTEKQPPLAELDQGAPEEFLKELEQRERQEPPAASQSS